MPVKDRVVNWFIKNIIIPKREIIDKPGFIITTFTEHKQKTYLRDLFLSEQLFELIENKIVEKYGDDGGQVLYSAGKKFGYLYASISNFPTIKDISKKKLGEFAYLMLRYMEGTYAKQATHNLDFEKKILTISFDNYIVCRHNGLGYIMLDGAVSGLWAYEMQDKTLEAVQLECQGRGNKRCLFISGPQDTLAGKTTKLFKETNLSEQKLNNIYRKMNQIRETTYSFNSLKKLIDNGFFKYKEGILSYKTIRLFHCESHILYLLEQEISKLPNGEQILFDVCFNYGQMLQEVYGGKDYKKFIPDYYPSLGFGDISVKHSKDINITAMYYPWTIYSKDSKYIIFRGIMSGIASNSLNKRIEFKNYKTCIRDYLTLKISE
jgi:predicted hydrocarbon binding protein